VSEPASVAAVLAPVLQAAYGMERATLLVQEVNRLTEAARWIPDFRPGVRHCAWCKHEAAPRNRYTFSLQGAPGGVHYVCRGCVDGWQARIDGARWGGFPPGGEMLVAEVRRAAGDDAEPGVAEASRALEAAARIPTEPVCRLCQASREGDAATPVLPSTVAVCARCAAMAAYYFTHRLSGG